MMRYSRSLVVAAVTAALAVPAVGAAQTAIPRNGGSSSGSSTGSGSGSGSSGSGEATSRGGSSEGSRVVLPPTGSFPTDGRRPSSSSRPSSSRVSDAPTTARIGGTPTSDGYSGSGAYRRGSAIARGGDIGSAGAGSAFVGSRSRDGRPVIGEAVERPFGYVAPNYNLYFPVDPFSPWGRWYPWYYGGFGYGYVSFDPWRYGTSRYSLYRYGSWYNPYDPWCYGVGYWLCDPWGGATTSSYGAGGGSSRDADYGDEPMASLRIKVSPAHAQVYVDGVLVGTVDDFDGLSDHLKVTIADHLIEIKADGYETFVPELEITANRTTTIRGSLKKLK
jgi:hypothetical protein